MKLELIAVEQIAAHVTPRHVLWTGIVAQTTALLIMTALENGASRRLPALMMQLST